MKSTIRIRFLSTLILVLFALPLQVVGAESVPFATVKAATQLTKWFSDLLRPFQEIGATAEKQYLIDALTNLNRNLFDVEQDKRYVVIALRRRPLVSGELRRTSVSIVEKIHALRESLKDLGPKLRLAYRAGADESIELLSDALDERKNFADNLGQVTEATADRNILEAQAAIQALSQAQRKLADVITALQKS